MKRLYRPSVEDFDAMPEDEWVEVVGGMKFRWADEKTQVKGKDSIVPLPAAVRKKFRLKEGEVLSARGSKGKVTVERSRRAKEKRPSKT